MKEKRKYDIADLSDHLFWDVDASTVDWDKESAYIIEKVVMYGTLNDWNIIKAVYGLAIIENIVLNLRFMDDKTLHLMSQLFDIPKKNFRCYSQRQFYPTHMPS